MNQHQLQTTMKKSIITSAIALIITGSAFAQPVSDRAVIPLGVTLQQILRIGVVNGGNIEFVFNDIDDYKNGIGNANSATGLGFYDSHIQIASSTNWELHLGAEDATFFGTDDPGRTLTLNNVGFQVTFNAGAFSVASTNYALGAGYPSAVAAVNALIQFTGTAADRLFLNGAINNGGDINDNNFYLHWHCGDKQGTMNAVAIIDQIPSVVADRYVTNVFLDINPL